MATKPPGGAQLINTHEDLLTAFTNIDQRLHRIIEGDAIPYIWRNKLYLPASMYNIFLGAIGNGGERNAALDATGTQSVEDVHMDEVLIDLDSIRYGLQANREHCTVGGAVTSYVTLQYTIPRMEWLEVTLTGGAAADQELVAVLTNYYGVVQPLALWTDTAGTYTFAFEDEDNADCVPASVQAGGGISTTVVTVDTLTPFGYDGVNTGTTPPVVTIWGPNDSKKVECDITGGAGTEKVALCYRYWWET